MAAEIELKAHVENIESLRRLLVEKTEYKSAFEKEDTYYFPSEMSELFPLDLSLQRSGFRLRREKRILPDDSENSVILLTHKKKEVRDGIEVNAEKEFEIQASYCHADSNQTAHRTVVEFGQLLEAMGLRPVTSKRKKGWAFCRDGITAELLEVGKLGWFLELEIISESDPKENFEDGKKRLLDFLDSLGIAREAIESRFYSEMLKNETQ